MGNCLSSQVPELKTDVKCDKSCLSACCSKTEIVAEDIIVKFQPVIIDLENQIVARLSVALEAMIIKQLDKEVPLT